MIIDGHAHVWPDAVAARALSGSGLDLPLYGNGTVAGLLKAMSESSVDHAVCLGIANTVQHVEKANRFAAELPEPLIGFGTVHPTMEPEAAVASLRRHQLKGVKLHPIFQDVRLDDKGLLRILDALRGEFVVIVHVGGGHSTHDERSSPALFRQLIRQLPGLDVVACHFGGYRLLDDAEEYVVGESAYLDTSWPPGLGTLPTRRIRDLIQRHGPERVVFASDWPTADVSAELDAVRNLGFGDEDTASILGGNLARLLGMETAA